MAIPIGSNVPSISRTLHVNCEHHEVAMMLKFPPGNTKQSPVSHAQSEKGICGMSRREIQGNEPNTPINPC